MILTAVSIVSGAGTCRTVAEQLPSKFEAIGEGIVTDPEGINTCGGTGISWGFVTVLVLAGAAMETFVKVA